MFSSIRFASIECDFLSTNQCLLLSHTTPFPVGIECSLTLWLHILLLFSNDLLFGLKYRFMRFLHFLCTWNLRQNPHSYEHDNIHTSINIHMHTHAICCMYSFVYAADAYTHTRAVETNCSHKIELVAIIMCFTICRLGSIILEYQQYLICSVVFYIQWLPRKSPANS